MTKPASMRAWRIHSYGGVDKLRLDSMPTPSPGPGELLVKVNVASINAIDWKIREGLLQHRYAIQFPRILGRDCAGTVIESRSPEFQAGDRVLSVADPVKDGVQSEYAIVPATASARIPLALSFEESMTFGIAGVSAWQPLVEIAQVGPGMRVLVHAGAGGVGSVGVQLARHFGAWVCSTCSTNNVEFVCSLGAHRAIDYTVEDFVNAAPPCDVVFDTVGGETHRRSYAALKAGGLLTYINAAPFDPIPPRADVRVVHAEIRTTTERLARQLELAAAGKLRGHFGQVFPFEEARAAHDLVQTGHARGKTLIKLH